MGSYPSLNLDIYSSKFWKKRFDFCGQRVYVLGYLEVSPGRNTMRGVSQFLFGMRHALHFYGISLRLFECVFVLYIDLRR